MKYFSHITDSTESISDSIEFQYQLHYGYQTTKRLLVKNGSMIILDNFYT